MADATVIKIALAGLRHDVGKFARQNEAMKISPTQERRRICL
jgi:HD superfamily phosphohydrolase YqeK